MIKTAKMLMEEFSDMNITYYCMPSLQVPKKDAILYEFDIKNKTAKLTACTDEAEETIKDMLKEVEERNSK